jgi:hypothetical protein
VAGGRDHADPQRAERELARAGDVLVGRETVRVAAVAEHPRAQPPAHRRRAAGVIGVAVRVEDPPRVDAVRGGERQRHLRVARVHERRVVARDEEVGVVVLAVAAPVEADRGHRGSTSCG